MKQVLVWGFYNQGNLGDDLMATIFYEILEEMGHTPLIYSANSRLKSMGYRTVSDLRSIQVDAIILGGGAFFKEGGSPNSKIEQEIKQLGSFIRDQSIPTFGLSLGSDGIHLLSQASVARRMVAESPYFRGAVVRLKRDLNLGIQNLSYLPDIVLLTNFSCQRYDRLHLVDPGEKTPEFLINLSRRSTLHLAKALWMSKGKNAAFFHAHTGKKKTGGEITLPILPVIDENEICKALGYLSRAEAILSSKLHPGVIAMSFGARYIPMGSRDKVKEFIGQSEDKLLQDSDKINGLWQSYRTHLDNFLN